MKRYIITLLILVQLAFASTLNGQKDPAFKLYFKAYEYVLDENWKSAITTFEEIKNKHKKSNYLDDSYYWIAYATKEQKNLKKAFDLYTYFINEFPKSNLFDNAKSDIHSLAERLIDSGSNDTKYKQVITQHSSSRRTDENFELQESAIYAISQLGGKEAQEKLYNILMDEKRPTKIRSKAMFWYGQSSKIGVSDLSKIYYSIKDYKLKEKSIFAISQKENKESKKFLMNIALNEKEDYKLRSKAIFWLAHTSSTDLDVYIDKLLTKITEPKLRKKVIFGIAQSNLKNKNDILYKIAIDDRESKQVRKQAIHWMGQSHGFRELKILYLQMENAY